jgi:hypothetical protein
VQEIPNPLRPRQPHRDEQTGFANLGKDLARMFRNAVACDPRALRAVTDTQLFELMTTPSMVHRRLDAAMVPNGSSAVSVLVRYGQEAVGGRRPTPVANNSFPNRPST